MACGPSSHCHELVFSVWLRYFLIILTYLFSQENKFRTELTKLRLSSHDLVIERGRYKSITRYERICKYCNHNGTESKYHFILVCPLYRRLRQNTLKILLSVVNLEQIWQLSTSELRVRLTLLEIDLSQPVKYFYWPFQGGAFLWIIYVISVLFLISFRAPLFIVALWSSAGKGLTSWLSFVMTHCEVFTFPFVSWSGMVLASIDS